jgi:hypothetical protein
MDRRGEAGKEQPERRGSCGVDCSVNQAVNAFKRHLPQSSSVNLIFSSMAASSTNTRAEGGKGTMWFNAYLCVMR